MFILILFENWCIIFHYGLYVWNKDIIIIIIININITRGKVFFFFVFFSRILCRFWILLIIIKFTDWKIYAYKINTGFQNGIACNPNDHYQNYLNIKCKTVWCLTFECWASKFDIRIIFTFNLRMLNISLMFDIQTVWCLIFECQMTNVKQTSVP